MIYVRNRIYVMVRNVRDVILGCRGVWLEMSYIGIHVLIRARIDCVGRSGWLV